MDQLDECQDCPLCMEPLEMDDVNFFPCTCGYQICRFCWHRLRTDENGLCPACRKAYTESPADYKPLTSEELQKIKQEKKQKELQRKHKVTESRKHLANVRVVQKNLVFVVGLSARLADAEQLKKIEYFGKFGKIHKVVINHTTSYAGSQGPSASAYVTYQRAEDALKAISQVNNIHVDGRTLKASLGTTKYCSHFMKNQQCPKNDCMYLHELGDEAASFTKEEMQQGKHQDFERKLQELYLGSSSTRNSGGSSSNEIIQPSNNKRVHKDSLSESSNGQSSGSNSRSSSTPLIASSAINSLNCGSNTHTIQPLDSIIINPGEGWPSLHTGGVCKDSVAGSSAGSNAVLNSSNAANSGNGGLAQGRKTRKHNGNNGTSSNGSHTGAATTNGTSPRHTPTRDHHNNSRRARNEENCNSNGGSRSNRDSPGATAASSESNSICSRNYVSSSSSSTSNTNDIDTLTISNSSNTGDHINFKPGSVSPSSHMNQKRPKSQSPNSSNTSGRSRTNGVNSSGNQSRHTLESNQSQQEELQYLQKQEHQSQSPTQESIETEPHIPETELLQDFVSHELQVQEPSLSISEPASSVSASPKSRASSAPSAEYSGDSSPIVNGSLTNHKQQLQELQQHLSLTDGDSDVLYADMSSVEHSVGQTHLTILQQQIATHSTGSEWALEEQRRQQLSEQPSDIWNPVRQNESTKVNDIDINADDLGFDPFEETNKALAEDIIIEKKQREEEQQRHQLQQQSFQQQLQLRQQQLQQQLQQQQLQHQQQSEAQSMRAGVKGLFGGTSSLSSLSAARLPPPGFNGLSTLGNFNSSLQQQQQQQRVDMNKLLPLLSGLNSSTMPQLNGLVSGRLGSGGPPPGLNLLAGLQHQGGVVGRLDAGGASTIMGPLDPNTLASHQQPPPPPGLSLPKQEPFAMKELENGLRNNAFSSINSLNTINNVNSINTLNSLNSSVANSLNTSIGSFNTLNGLTSLNPLASLSALNSNSINSLNSNLNFGALNSQAQQQQQNSLSALNSVNAFGGLNLATVQQQQQQSAGNSVLPNLFNLSQQPPMSQQSRLHQLALQNTQKGWNSGGTDLTALDPAIVSSGQLTDSRSDSPPDWLRMMEQHMAGGGDASLAWPSLLPHHHHQQQQQQQGINTSSLQQLCGGGAGVHVNASLSSQQQVSLLHQQLAVQQQQQQQRASMVWPPTSPPPGFSNISPLHQPKHQQTHKIDNV